MNLKDKYVVLKVWKHDGLVVGIITSQKEGPRFEPISWLRGFLCGVRR